MNKLDELIQKHCPDGVEYKTISDISTVSIGEFVHKNKRAPVGKYPVYNGGTTNTGYYTDYNRTANKIIISARGANAGFVNRVFCNYWSGNSCYSIEIFDENTNWNYVYYWLKNNERKLLGNQQKGGIPAVSKKQVEETVIALPSLPVQEEIVRILDNFTELTAELTAELEARKKQYEYYRSKLLTFDDILGGGVNNIIYLRIEELCEVQNGYTPSKKISEYWDNGDFPWFRMEDIRTNGKELSDSIQHVNLAGVKGKGFPADSIIFATTATIGEHALITVPFICNQQLTHIHVKENIKSILNIRFLFYYSYIIDELCKKNIKGGSILPTVSIDKFKQFLVPIPPLEEQKKIVSILDRFDSLCNDITSGLPAEIAARQKQYEYYREKLLDFKLKTKDF